MSQIEFKHHLPPDGEKKITARLNFLTAEVDILIKFPILDYLTDDSLGNWNLSHPPLRPFPPTNPSPCGTARAHASQVKGSRGHLISLVHMPVRHDRSRVLSGTT